MSRIAEQFQPGLYGALPGHRDDGASRAAAVAVSGGTADLQDRCVAALKQHGPMTADEIAENIQRKPGAVRPRLSELKGLGRVVKTGARRKNESGLSASVWRIP